MADSGRTRPTSPYVADRDAFIVANSKLFAGSAEGRYLQNRIEEAFRLGWLACEKRVKEAVDGR